MVLTCFLNDFEMVPVVPIITGIALVIIIIITKRMTNVKNILAFEGTKEMMDVTKDYGHFCMCVTFSNRRRICNS
jgi:hypothetical protein